MNNLEQAMILPEGSMLLCLEDMRLVEGGGTVKLKIKKDSIIIKALSAAGAGASAWAMTAALEAAATSIATAVTLGTAGLGTLYAGAFLIAFQGIIPAIVGFAVENGISALSGHTFKLSHKALPNKTITI